MGKFCHADVFKPVTSYLTGRTLYVNLDPQRFLVPPTFTPGAARVAGWDLLVLIGAGRVSRRPTKALHEIFHTLASVETREEFEAFLDAVLEDRTQTLNPHRDQPRVRDALTRLWQAGCVIWPVDHRDRLGETQLSGAWGWGERASAMAEAFNGAQGVSGPANNRLRAFLVLLLSRGGIQDVGDLTPDVTDSYFENQMKTGLRQTTAAPLLELQKAAYGDRVTHSLEDFGRFGRPRVRSDNTFIWAVEADPSVEAWRTAAADFMRLQNGALQGKRSILNGFFDYLIANPLVPRIPTDYLRTNFSGASQFTPKSRHNHNWIVEFFDFILDTHCVDEDDFGFKVRLPGFRNPLSLIRQSSNRGETHRSPMPTRFVRMLHQILTENDYAWPKTVGRTKWGAKLNRGDWFVRTDPETGDIVEEWSPVRTVAILIKLLLPPRTFQVRVLDSGEGDSEVYRPQHGWVKNIGHFSPVGKTKVERGVLYRHRDQEDGTEHIYLRFNTNKTADLAKEDTSAGFIMPWEHKEAISLLVWLRDWQEKYNAISKPTLWGDIVESDIRDRYTREALVRRGEACFLFRDPVAKRRDQPITDPRLRRFWMHLCAELERRLAEAGETLPDGSAIILLERDESGGLGAPVYDLHSLRVTIISALAETGGVPVEILMKVVGHASVIMSLYYQKISPNHISERLNAADMKRQREEQADWQRWLVNKDREILLKAVAFVDPAGVDAMSSVSASSWVDRQHGICPVGCGRCHEGGALLYDKSTRPVWGEVPGGATNCVRCRFFITGPVFLNGLNAFFDSVTFRLREASVKYQAAKRRFEGVEAEYNASRDRGEPVPRSRIVDLDVASGLLDQQTKAVDELAMTWNATYRLIQQCMAIVRMPRQKGDADGSFGYALVAVGGAAGLEVALESSTEFELADRICQSAVFYEGIDPAVPNLRRMRAFDAMLKRHGYEPAFIEMAEDDALAVGNQMAAYLYARRGRDEVNALLEGRETLRRLGIEENFIKSLTSASPIRIRRQSTGPAAIE